MFWKIAAHPGESRCSLSPNEHLGLGKWLHSALFRREKRILWLQTTLSVNILQLSARLSDDKPHAARRAANLRPYGYHFIVIFHGRNVNGRCLPQPSLTAPLSTLKRLPRPCLPAAPTYRRSFRQALCRPGTGALPPSSQGGPHRVGQGVDSEAASLFFRQPALESETARVSEIGERLQRLPPAWGPPSAFLPCSGLAPPGLGWPWGRRPGHPCTCITQEGLRPQGRGQ